MARSGGKRTYVRDANGRFASTPGGGSKSLSAARKAARPTSGRKGTLQARTSLKKSRAKLTAKDPADQRLSTSLSTRAQKAAVTRGNKGLKAAKVAARTQISGGRKGVIGKPKGPKLRSAMLMGKGKAPTSRLGKPVKQEDGSFDVNGRPAKNMQDAMRVLKQQRAQEKERALSAQRITAQRQVDRQDLRQVELGTGTRSSNKYARTRAIDILFQKQRKASDKIKEVAQQGRSMQNEFNKLVRKPSKASAKRMEQLKTNMNRLRKSMDVLQKAERSYSERFKLQQRILSKSRKPKL